MRLPLQKYDVKITYNKETQLLIGDTLSPAHPTNSEDVQDDAVGKQEFSVQLEEINLETDIPIAEERQSTLPT